MTVVFRLVNSQCFSVTKSAVFGVNSIKRRFFSEMSKSACVFLAPGCEEIEFCSSVDILRRAKVAVTVAAVQNDLKVTGANGLTFVGEKLLKDVKNEQFDALVMPGGMGGLEAFQKSTDVGEMLKKQLNDNRIIAAICAAPVALATHKVAVGKSFTCYPSMEKTLVDAGYKYDSGKPVVVDGNLITSRGPGTAAIFALTVVEQLLGKDAAKNIAKAMLIDF